MDNKKMPKENIIVTLIAIVLIVISIITFIKIPDEVVEKLKLHTKNYAHLEPRE